MVPKRSILRIHMTLRSRKLSYTWLQWTQLHPVLRLSASMASTVLILAVSLKITGSFTTQDLPEWFIIMEQSLQDDDFKAYLRLMGLKPSLLLQKNRIQWGCGKNPPNYCRHDAYFQFHRPSLEGENHYDLIGFVLVSKYTITYCICIFPWIEII